MDFLLIVLLFSATIFENASSFKNCQFFPTTWIKTISFVSFIHFMSMNIVQTNRQHFLYQNARGQITPKSAVYLSKAVSRFRFNRCLCIEVCLLLEMVYLLLWTLRGWIVGCVYGQWTQWTLWDQLVFSAPLKYHVCLSPERIYFADSLLCTCVRAERIRFSSYLFASFFSSGVDGGRVELL